MIIEEKDIDEKSMNFRCDVCYNKISFWETLQLKKNHITICDTCGAKLYPIKVKSFDWGFIIGFGVIVVSGEIVYRLTGNLTKTFSLAFICSIIAISGVAFNTYKTTRFKSIL